MSDAREEEAAKAEAAENVVERAESWDPGAEPETVESNLRKGFQEAGVDVEDSEIERVARDVHAEKHTELDPDDVG